MILKSYFTKSLILLVMECSLSGNVWKEFNQNPNEQNYKVCLKQLNGLKHFPIDSQDLPYIQLIKKGEIGDFLERVESGNKYAVELCFHLFPAFRGHVEYLETFDISLGKVINVNPELFLSMLHKYEKGSIKKYIHISGLLGNYGDEYVDRFDKQIEETKRRINSIKQVKNAEYQELVERCLIFYDEELKSLEEQK